MRLALVLVAILVGGAVVAVIAMAIGGDDDDGGSSSDASTTTTAASLSDDAQDLLARLERGRDGAVHVRMASAEGALAGGSVTVEMWRDDDLVRQDVTLDSVGSYTEVSAFQLADGNVLCQRAAADAPWECQRSASVASENGDPVGLIEAVADNLRSAEVTASDDEVNGTAVRCYAIERPDGTSSLCLSEDGVPMRLSTQGQELTATSVDHEVDGEVFTPPAELTGE